MLDWRVGFFWVGWGVCVAYMLDVEGCHAGRFLREARVLWIWGFGAWLGDGFHEAMMWMYSVAYWISLFTPALRDVVVRCMDMCECGDPVLS